MGIGGWPLGIGDLHFLFPGDSLFCVEFIVLVKFGQVGEMTSFIISWLLGIRGGVHTLP